MRRLAALLLLIPVLAAACGGNDGEAEGADTAQEAGTLTVYSGREEELVAPLFELFKDETGIDVEVRYGDSAELAATIAEEGDQTPADVFFAQDPGSLGSLEEEGPLAELPPEILERVPERFRDPDGRWVGTSGRVRVIAYNTEALAEEEVPDSVFDLTDPAWKGRIGFPPTNASFQAFVTAMRLSEGEERTREWLEGVDANEPKLYENNLQTVEAVAAGEIEVGLVNHYYLYLVKEDDADAPVENHFLAPGDPGALVSVAGAGVLAPTDDRESAGRFVEFLLSHEGQRFYAERAEEAEYPLVEGIEPREGLPPLSELEGPNVRLDAFGGELEETLELLNEVGFTS
ncbi:MAG: iron ABC transporter substrate-binding protein [Actinomycetota bacterium]|nr:iron ABC transporter substrate-binding protein [Actinomycetota bacterium]